MVRPGFLSLIRRHGTACLLLLASLSLFRMLLREPWFDECLTLDLAVSLSGPAEIYRSYWIPNNHIVFTQILHGFHSAVSAAADSFPFFVLRLPSVFAFLLALFLLRRMTPRGDASFGVLFCLAFSLPAAVYGTALRGYAFGFLFTVLAFGSAHRFFRRGTPLPLLLFSLWSLLAAGTAPTNLASLTAAGLFFLPHVFVRNGRRNRVLPLLLIPSVMLFLFYFPIRDMFLHCVSLKEGWHGAASAAGHFYLAALLTFLPVLPFALRGAWILLRRRPRMRIVPAADLLILLLPACAYLILPVPPFPRVFFPLFAVWAVILVRMSRPAFRTLSDAGYAGFLLAAFVWIFLVSVLAPRISDAFCGQGGIEDDLLYPYYVRTGFSPARTAKILETECGKDPGSAVFLSFSSDYPSLLFAASGVLPPEKIVYDRPNKPPVEELPSGRVVLLCVRTGEDVEPFRRRFSLGVPDGVFPCGFQTVYRFPGKKSGSPSADFSHSGE